MAERLRHQQAYETVKPPLIPAPRRPRMRFASLAGLLAILPLAAGAPAAAQTLPRELFLPPKRPLAIGRV